jgi:PAS domain S-box-containing protein
MTSSPGDVPSEAELLRAVVDKISAMLAYWDASQRCRYANSAYERWFGVSPRWLVGRHMRELLGPLYAVNLPYIEAALRGEPQEFEREVPDPAGGPPRHSLANYIPDVVDGVVRGFYAFVSDVTPIKCAQLALRESEERFALTLDEAPIGMALVGLDGRFLRVNRALCDLVGYTAEELVGLTFQAITHPGDLDTDLAAARRLERGELTRYEAAKRYLRKDGAVVDVMLHVSVVRGRDGRPLHYISQVEDITERKRREEEQAFLAEVGLVLARSLDYAETLRQVVGLAVSRVVDVCMVEVLDDAAERMRLEIASRDPARAAACEAMKRLHVDRRRPFLLRGAVETRTTDLLVRPSPEEVAALAQSEEHLRALRELGIQAAVNVPLLAHDRVLGAISFVSSDPGRLFGPADVRLFEELARRAALSIDNARLYQEARRAAQMRDEVLGVVAHDLRTPLGGILLHAEKLRRRGAPPGRSSSQAAGAILRAVERMDHLIQDLLDVARLDAGRLELEPARVPVQDLLAEAVDAERALAAAAGVELRVEAAAELPDVWAERERLLQVFMNVIGNALKFTPRGGQVVVSAAADEEAVRFCVRDTGAGLAADDLPLLFDRFWQARRADRRGVGLGLPIAKGIVEAHRGRIWAESALGQGSTFHFTIPTAAAAAAWRRASGRVATPDPGAHTPPP